MLSSFGLHGCLGQLQSATRRTETCGAGFDAPQRASTGHTGAGRIEGVQNASLSGMTEYDSANATVFLPRVGIVSPCRNRLKKTRRFYEHMLAQSFRNFRIYLCDSASTDGTAEYFLNVQALEPRLRVIPALDSEYWTGATNRGVRAALDDGCEYVMTINDDFSGSADFLKRMVAAAAATRNSLLVPRIDFLDQPGRVWAIGSSNDWRKGEILKLDYHGAGDDPESLPVADEHGLFRVQFACGNGLLIRRAVFERTGLFDERWMPHYHADSDLILRAGRFGIVAYCVLGAVLLNDTKNARDRMEIAAPAAEQLREWLPVRLLRALASKRSEYYAPAVFAFVVPGTASRERCRGYCASGLGRIYGRHAFEPRTESVGFSRQAHQCRSRTRIMSPLRTSTTSSLTDQFAGLILCGEKPAAVGTKTRETSLCGRHHAVPLHPVNRRRRCVQERRCLRCY